MKTIWIVNNAGHAYHKALKLYPGAELKFLTEGNINPLKPERLLYQLAKGIGRFAVAGDPLLISGTPMVNAMALVLWMMRFESVTVLQWNAIEREYEATTLEGDDLEELLAREMVG